jgi:mannosyltransferase OCH1-like enzyme
MHSKTFYIILGCGILFIALSILVCSGLFNPYEGMDPEQYRRYNKKFMKRKPYSQNIEKNIFQTWRTKDIPQEFKYITEYLKLQNPEYNYYLYDDDDIDNFIKTYYPKYWTSYKMLAPEYGAARADFFRYMVIYHYGGVYLDIKSGASVPFTLKNILTGRLLPKRIIHYCVMF